MSYSVLTRLPQRLPRLPILARPKFLRTSSIQRRTLSIRNTPIRMAPGGNFELLVLENPLLDIQGKGYVCFPAYFLSNTLAIRDREIVIVQQCQHDIDSQLLQIMNYCNSECILQLLAFQQLRSSPIEPVLTRPCTETSNFSTSMASKPTTQSLPSQSRWASTKIFSTIMMRN